MSKFNFIDGQDLCVYENGKISKFSSAAIERIKQNLESVARSKEWKNTGEGANFRGDVFDKDSFTQLKCNITAAFPTANGEDMVYIFTANNSSGIYKKVLTDKKIPESHVINSVDVRFRGGCFNAENNLFVTEVQRNDYNSDIGVFSDLSGDYKLVTDGDTLDEDPSICPDDQKIIYYSSRGVGRNGNGEFVCFSPAAICRLDTERVEVEEVVSSEKFSYFKPIMHGGKLYAIKAPVKEHKGNPLLEIILIPWRILQAIAGFINLFVKAFAGKSLTSGGSNPTKGREYDSKKIVIRGNLIDVEKQAKHNASKKDTEGGFVPLSWQLIEVESGKVIKSGIADYDICEDGTIIATNGRKIFEIKDGNCKKVCDAQCCLRVDCKHTAKGESPLFNL